MGRTGGRVAMAVRAARARRGMTQLEVAQSIGRPKSWYVDLERGKVFPGTDEMNALASALMLDPVALSEATFLDKYHRAADMLPASWFDGVGEEILAAIPPAGAVTRPQKVNPASYATIEECAHVVAAEIAPGAVEFGEHIDVSGALMDVVALERVRAACRIEVGLEAGVFAHEGYGTEEGRCEFDAHANVVRVLLRDDVWERAVEGEGRSRFTAAHELGHAVIHWRELSEAPNGAQLFRDAVCTASQRAPSGVRVFEWAEWQSNAFAGALLMPQEAVARFLARRHASGLDCEIEDLAEQFRVSRRAAEIRMGKLLPKLVPYK